MVYSTSSGSKQFRSDAPFAAYGKLILGIVLFVQGPNLAFVSGVLRIEEESGLMTYPDSSRAGDGGNDPDACEGT